MRLLLMTQDEPFYLPQLVRRVCDARGSEVVGIALMSPLNQSFAAVAGRMLRTFGWWYFLREGAAYVGCKALDAVSGFVPLPRPYSVRRLARRRGIPLYEPKDVNADVFLRTVREEIRPDLIVSLAASQIFKAPLLAIPPKGSINLHSSLLPRHRGMLPTFWALLSGEAETGVTVHYIDDRLDHGDIVVQERVPIGPDDTFHDLVARCKEAGTAAVLAAVDQIAANTTAPRPMGTEGASYHSFPTAADVRALRALGRRLL